MTAAAYSINPAQQSNFAGTFFVSSDGYTQGDALDDPAIRFLLRKGIVSPSSTVPMWGGLLISESLTSNAIGGVGATAPGSDLQSILVVAANITAGNAAGYTGVTVFNQATAMLQSAQQRVPIAPAAGAINFYRSGSGARIPLACTSTAAAAWSGGVVDPTTIFWDTVNLCLVSAAGANIIGPIPGMTLDAVSLGTSRTVNVSANASGYNTTGLANWLETGYTAIVRI
jgi:hypothetical protein